MKSSVIKIISYEEKNLKGILYNPFFENARYFDNLTQCLFLLEMIMDSLQFPQRSMEHRLFTQSEQDTDWLLEPTEEQKKAHVLASFRVSVLFRQNASWQGSLFWQEKGLEASFRSVLELVGLMDNALCEGE